MTIRRLFIAGLLFGAGAAWGADDAKPQIPVLAANAGRDLSASSPWAGFYAGTSVFALAGSHHASAVGGAGSFGINHEFENRIVVGVEGTAGLARGSFGQSGFNGLDYAGTSVKLGYDMGRIMPYLFAGVDVAKPVFHSHGGFTNSGDALNDLFTGSSKLRTFTTAGAGIEYAVSNRLTLGLAVSATQGRGSDAYAPFAPPLRLVP